MAIESHARPSTTYTVLTWLDEAKAVAMARERFERAHPAVPIHPVEVTPLGPAPSSVDGTVEIGRDLFDRTEF